MKAEFLHNPSAAGQHAHCALLHPLLNGDLLAVWYGHPDVEDYKDAQICISRKSKSSNEWSKGELPLQKFSSSAGNPVLFQDPTTEILWLLFVLLKGNYWNDAVLHSCFSLDNGHTWSAPQVAWPDKGMMVRHPPLYINNGTPLLPAYDEINNHSLLLKRISGDWQIADAFADYPAIQPSLTKEQSGRLCLFFRPVKEPKVVWRAHSNNDGASWSQLIRTNIPCPLSGVSSFATSRGIALVYNHADHGRTPLSISHSTDGGVVWSGPWHIDQIEHELSYPHFIATEDGIVHGVYTYNRRMIKYVTFTFDELYERL